MKILSGLAGNVVEQYAFIKEFAFLVVKIINTVDLITHI